MSKLSLYWNTVRYLKQSQVYYRLRKMLRIPCTLGVLPQKANGNTSAVETATALDFDPVFLARFPAEELMADTVTFLHESERFQWEAPWAFPERSPLWNYNLHYFEYGFSLIKAYKDKSDACYLDKLKQIILAWIRQNPRGAGAGWDPYPIALRLTNWLSFYVRLKKEFDGDTEFRAALEHSIWEQYDHLAHHLEKDLLANHYFEDLKALVLCALFFADGPMFAAALKEFKAQCREQILPDGMHFELSPMYHKIILEDVLRVAAALRGAGKADAEVEGYIQPMLDVAYSLEEGLERIPLFNDCGNNVAKSLEALCLAAKEHFGIEPRYKAQMPDSGYYIFRQNGWKLIVDAGQPGPKYIPGHAHCDAMSFELFKDGRPVIVNCGTYAYQCGQRQLFKSTAAHNTVMVSGTEQSECWGSFRMARRARIEDVEIREQCISMRMADHLGHEIVRTMEVTPQNVIVTDEARGEQIESYLHFADDSTVRMIDVQKGKVEQSQMPYAEEFGVQREIQSLRICGKETVRYNVRLSDS